MNAKDFINALELPVNSYVNQRVPKKLLVENGAPTPGDMRQINEGIEDLHWVAALKPTTVGVPSYRDDIREILEIAVLSLTLRESAKVGRLNELVHRAVPYPVVLITELGPNLTLSLAQKRWSQGEVGKTVLEGEIIDARIDDELNGDLLSAFKEALALVRQPRGTLYSLYEGWIDTVLTLQTAHVTGVFSVPASVTHAITRREALQTCYKLESQMEELRTAAAKEKQLPRQVEFNLKLKRLEADYSAVCARL